MGYWYKSYSLSLGFISGFKFFFTLSKKKKKKKKTLMHPNQKSELTT